MTFSSSASVPTEHAGKYLGQICKHWAHNLKVEYTPEQGSIIFPRDARGADWPGDAKVTLTPHGQELHCQIDASAPEQLEGLKGALARHLDRFAFREAPLAFSWHDQ
jgi:hypothetical protein